eukprot:TRINITY_DN21168_c1_g1_i1.p2 TRINITY_DN21168_c1_g1~~TRINITY_DN21168_c1_g1_i1.p2  ORF type:complete len:153 (+),score=11.36 TRINITY_DN21168_c1_g1_i1:91-549(+)
MQIQSTKLHQFHRPGNLAFKKAPCSVSKPFTVSVRAQSTDVSNAPKLAEAITDAQWETEVLKSDGLVLVDFWAQWCGPCKLLAQVVDEIAGEYEGKLKFKKMNTDENPKTTQSLGIRSIPTIYLYKKGVQVDTIVGAVRKESIQNSIDRFLD